MSATGIPNQLSSYATASTTEIYDLLGNEQRARCADTTQIQSKLDAMERKLVEVENHLSLLVSAIAINPTLRANTVKDTNMGQYTRSVMCKVPAVLLLVLWRSVKENQPFPTNKEYIEKLFSALGEQRSVELRKELGIVISTVIDKGSALTIDTMSALLSDTNSTRSSIMREQCMHLYKRISTTHAFMVPQVLGEFVLHISGITTGGEVQYDHAAKHNRTSVIEPGAVYDAMGPDWLGKAPMMDSRLSPAESTRCLPNDHHLPCRVSSPLRCIPTSLERRFLILQIITTLGRNFSNLICY